MTREEALCWLEQVGGTIFHNPKKPDTESAWVAVVRTPRSGSRAGKIIMAFGETLECAAIAAEDQWQEIWGGLSSQH